MHSDEADRRFMAAAIRLSRRNEGLTGTNPSVGTLLVKDGRIVGRGVTALGGRPHAEPQAAEDAGDDAAGSTAYATLEPCAHTGKTPPCARRLVADGIARTVIAASDPDPRVSGNGAAILRDAGIAVSEGVEADAARETMAGYLSVKTTGRPHVILKLAVSTDGFIGKRGVGQTPITGAVSQRQVHMMRARADAIMVGAGTVREDDPSLTVRLAGLADRSPLRVVLAGRRGLPNHARLAKADHRTLMIPASETMADTSDNHGPSLERMLRKLAKDRLVATLMVEGGASLASQLLRADLVDEIVLFIGPDALGGDVPSPIAPHEVPPRFSLTRRETFERDTCLTMRRS